MTTNQILTGLGLILALAVGSQALAYPPPDSSDDYPATCRVPLARSPAT